MICHNTYCECFAFLQFSDEWESDEDDDEGEWMDVYHSSEEEEKVQSVYGFFVFVQFVIVICRFFR